MKQVNFILVFFIFYIFHAQSQCLDLEYGCDTVKTNNFLSNYTEYYKQKSFSDAYEPWKWLVENSARLKTLTLYMWYSASSANSGTLVNR